MSEKPTKPPEAVHEQTSSKKESARPLQESSAPKQTQDTSDAARSLLGDWEQVKMELHNATIALERAEPAQRPALEKQRDALRIKADEAREAFYASAPEFTGLDTPEINSVLAGTNTLEQVKKEVRSFKQRDILEATDQKEAARLSLSHSYDRVADLRRQIERLDTTRQIEEAQAEINRIKTEMRSIGIWERIKDSFETQFIGGLTRREEARGQLAQQEAIIRRLQKEQERYSPEDRAQKISELEERLATKRAETEKTKARIAQLEAFISDTYKAIDQLK